MKSIKCQYICTTFGKVIVKKFAVKTSITKNCVKNFLKFDIHVWDFIFKMYKIKYNINSIYYETAKANKFWNFWVL